MKNLVELIKLPLISTFCSSTSKEVPYNQGAKHNKQSFVNHLGCSCHISLIWQLPVSVQLIAQKASYLLFVIRSNVVTWQQDPNLASYNKFGELKDHVQQSV